MPVIWNSIEGAPADAGALFHGGDAPLHYAVLRPNRSLGRVGFAWLLVIVWGFLLVPVAPLLGSHALWVMLPFLLAVLAALGFAIDRNSRDGESFELLRIWEDRLQIDHKQPRQSLKSWSTNPYWLRLHLSEDGGPVEFYLTLKAEGREIELGRFLSPEERVQLKADLEERLIRARLPE